MESDVLEDAEVRVKRVGLECHSHVAQTGFQLVDDPVAQVDVSAVHRGQAAIIFRIEVFPAPDGPRIKKNSEFLQCRDSSSTATVSRISF